MQEIKIQELKVYATPLDWLQKNPTNAPYRVVKHSNLPHFSLEAIITGGGENKKEGKNR